MKISAMTRYLFGKCTTQHFTISDSFVLTQEFKCYCFESHDRLSMLENITKEEMPFRHREYLF